MIEGRRDEEEKHSHKEETCNWERRNLLRMENWTSHQPSPMPVLEIGKQVTTSNWKILICYEYLVYFQTYD